MCDLHTKGRQQAVMLPQCPPVQVDSVIFLLSWEELSSTVDSTGTVHWG